MENDNNRAQDRHLQAPAEANRDKHINFLAEEQGDGDPAEDNRDTLTHFGDSTYQTKEEFEKDKGSQLKDEGVRSSVLSEDGIGDRVAGDASGTSELSSQQNAETGALGGSDNKNASAERGM